MGHVKLRPLIGGAPAGSQSKRRAGSQSKRWAGSQSKRRAGSQSKRRAGSQSKRRAGSHSERANTSKHFAKISQKIIEKTMKQIALVLHVGVGRTFDTASIRLGMYSDQLTFGTDLKYYLVKAFFVEFSMIYDTD